MALSKADFARRIERTRKRMADAGLDALFVFSDEYRPGHAFYYTNYKTCNQVEESYHGVYVPLEGHCASFTGALNTFAARHESYIDDVRSIFELEHEIRTLVEQSPRPIRKLGLVGETVLPLSIYRLLEAGLGGGVEIVEASRIVVEERQIKTAEEVELLKRAGEVSDISLRTTLRYLKPGLSEQELVAIGEHATRIEGAEPGCVYIAVAGVNTEMPTWRPTSRPVQRGEVLMLDYAAAVDGYNSDVAVTVALEGCSDEQRRVVDFGWHAAARMMEFYQPGRPAREVFEKTLEMVRQAGYEDRFLPYTKGMRAIGHGVGVDVVEPPDLGPESDYTLEPGMALAAKFDLHGFDWGGVRMEHVVAITAEGPVSLNCPLSDACPARKHCKFYRPGGGSIDIPARLEASTTASQKEPKEEVV